MSCLSACPHVRSESRCECRGVSEAWLLDNALTTINECRSKRGTDHPCMHPYRGGISNRVCARNHEREREREDEGELLGCT